MIDHSTSELPDNDEQPIVCPCCNELKCDCFGSGCSICHKCQGHCSGPQEHTPERICLLPQDQIKLVSVDGHDIIGTLEMDDRERIAFCRVDGAIISLTDETDLDTIFALIMRCRSAQDKEHGGPAHDDTHTPSDWCGFSEKFRNRAEFPKSTEEYEASLIHVASLAIAAIESSRRKRAVQPR